MFRIRNISHYPQRAVLFCANMHLYVILVSKLEKNTQITELMAYGLDVLGLESRQGQQIYIFSRTSELAPGLTQPPTQ